MLEKADLKHSVMQRSLQHQVKPSKSNTFNFLISAKNEKVFLIFGEKNEKQVGPTPESNSNLKYILVRRLEFEI